MSVKYNIQNLARVKRNFKRMQDRMTDGTKAGNVGSIVVGKMLQDVDKHFRAEAGPKGPWKPFSPNTTRKRGDMGSAKLLQDTGRLRQSSRGFFGRKEVGLVNRVSYAGIHQKGGSKIPQRKFFWLSDKALSFIGGIFGRYIAQGKKR